MNSVPERENCTRKDYDFKTRKRVKTKEINPGHFPLLMREDLDLCSGVEERRFGVLLDYKHKGFAKGMCLSYCELTVCFISE